MGGLGKTQLSQKYVQDNKADYQFKYWLESETPEKLKNSFKELAQVLNIKSDNINKVVNDFYKKIAAIPTILVFDNVEKPADVYAYLPTRVDLPPGVSIHVLVTSRDVLQHANERVSAVVNYCKESPSPRILECLVKCKAIIALEAVLKLISKNHIQIAMKEHDLLNHAVVNGDLNITRLLCKYGADINQPVSFRRYLPLHLALKTRNMEIATWLLENGAAPTVQDESAARDACVAVVSLILQLNKHLIDIKNVSGEAALQVIPYDNRYMGDDRILSTIRVLIESGVDLTNVDIRGNTVLHSAARRTHVAAVSFILKLNKNLIDIRNKDGDTALHVIPYDDILRRIDDDRILSTIRVLLESGADLTKVNVRGNTVLHSVACRAHVAAVSLILQLNKDIINIVNKCGKTALQVIPYNNTRRLIFDDRILSTIRVFLESGADFTNVDELGNTVLHSAAEAACASAVSLILQINKHLIDIKNEEGRTALHVLGNDFNIIFKHLPKDVSISYTYFARMKDTARVLLMNGLSLHIRDNKGCTPIVTVNPEFKDILVKVADECNNQLHE
ncbi:Ankyrin 2 [Carabus blaptoides fortunei]